MLRIRYYTLVLCAILLCISNGFSQERKTEICVDFKVNSTIIDPAYSNNAARVQEIIDLLRDIKQDTTITLLEVSFCGAASPEGSYQLNRRLARGRLEALENIVRKEVFLPDSIVTHNDSYIPWDTLKEQIAGSDIEYKTEVLYILNNEAALVDYNHPSTQIDSRIIKLQALNGGTVWQQMNRQFFSKMRNACAVFVTYKQETTPEPAIEPEIEPEPEIKPEEPIQETVVPVVEEQVEVTMANETEECPSQLHVKTNILGLGLAIANAAVEVDLFNHCSITLPVYYSAWDYFKTTIKFRTLSVQPELRYWIKECNDGLFAGAHFGLSYYNIALDGDYRYQDHNRETPALGGGVSFGYRFPISRNGRWKAEFSLGAGVYPVHYDKFNNTPNTKDGLMVSSHKKTYIGLDQANASITYAFDLKKKGGRR